MYLEKFKRIPFVRPAYHFLVALCAAAFYGFPSRKLFVIGVTGTKGKTTVLEFMNSILEVSGKKTALLSSIKVKVGGITEKNRTSNTMPGRFFIQAFLSRAAKAKCDYVLLEVTSEGIPLSRHRFIKWSRAFLINLHPEHVESHGSFEKYRGAKLEFLRYAAEQGGSIFIHKDDPNASFFTEALKDANPALYSVLDCSREFGEAKDNEFLQSDFNRADAAAAIALAKDLGISEEQIIQALRNFSGVPGRMEFVQRSPFAVVVDYAHTPQSLEVVYKALRSTMTVNNDNDKNSHSEISHSSSSTAHRQSHSERKLICVLGSAGGGRDKWKRPIFGKIAADHCDQIVLTNEDPYDEDPEVIMDEISRGFADSPHFDAKLSGSIMKIVDRREAIQSAIQMATPGDTVLIIGKGSEEWIRVAGGKKIPWSDVKIAKEVLEERNKPR